MNYSRDLEDIERAIHNLSGDISGSVRFATSHHIGLHRLPPVFEEFHREYPAVGLDVRFLDSEQACQQVSRGETRICGGNPASARGNTTAGQAGMA